ncbi:MAG: hypothetical protein ACWGQW_23260 [bacterium]
MARVKWSDERIIAEIRNHCQDTNSLRPTVVKKSFPALYWATKTRGGWAHWVKRAGLKYPWTRERWTKKKLITRLREAHNMGLRLTRRELLRHPRYRGVATSYVAHFKAPGKNGKIGPSWSAFLKEAGFPLAKPKRPPYKWTDEKILEGVRGLSDVTLIIAEEENYPLVSATERRYGG